MQAMFIRRVAGAILAALLLFASLPSIAHPPEPPAGKRAPFLTLSDIHFAPFYDTTLVARLVATDYPGWRAIFESSRVRGLGTYGQETGYPLLKSLLENMRRVEGKPGFIILTGDLLAHNFRGTFNSYATDRSDSAYDRFVYRTMGFLAMMIGSYFPATPVIPALGNNDSYSGNYSVGPRARFLADFERLWAPLVARSGNGGSFARDFPVGGYYSLPDPIVKGRRVIALNTIFFSAKYCNRCDSASSFCTACDTSAPYPGDIELAWLDSALAASASRGERVWLAYHIPPGIDVFNSIDSLGGCGAQVVPFWGKRYEDGFMALMKKYAATITASFAGHTHMDDFRLLADGGDPFGFIHVTPAVSPVYDNNPGFQLWLLDRVSGTIEDYATHFVDLTSPSGRTWRKEYEFGAAYGARRYDLASLVALRAAILSDPKVRERYIRFYPVSSRYDNAITQRNWHGYGCGFESLGVDEFTACCSGR
jgi:hypothetical protein